MWRVGCRYAEAYLQGEARHVRAPCRSTSVALYLAGVGLSVVFRPRPVDDIDLGEEAMQDVFRIEEHQTRPSSSSFA
jgi:hypothetical protein